ncbi:MAG: triphosphoribosyl-dephospho-CoA synthase [Clostridia bacterium]|nr:triphosphoribosyl-dephospho-CoA synthase [Clostridia bacterium]
MNINIVEHFDLVYPLLDFNANLIIGVGEQVLIARPNLVVQDVRNLLKTIPEPTKRQIEVLDDDFIKRNLSPGGCANLLATTYFLYSLK